MARLALHNARPPPGVGVNIVFHDDDDLCVFEAVVALLGDDAVLLGPARRPPPALPHHRHGLRQEVRHSIVSPQSVPRSAMFGGIREVEGQAQHHRRFIQYRDPGPYT